jgi:hypothetical protein
MTPAERALVTELFDRLATLEDAERDREAERLVWDGLRQAPNAPYSLVQTVLLQDEALKRAEARIRELESEHGVGAPPARQPGFLDSMREALGGRREESRAGSVPSVRSSDAPASSAWGTPGGYRTGGPPIPGGPLPEGPMPGEPMRSGGSSFLGNAAAAAVGVIGGSLLANSMRGMMGGHGHGAGAFDQDAAGTGRSGSPWNDAAGGELSRQAGVDDIGHTPSGRDGGSDRGHGLFDTAANEPDQNDDELEAGDDDSGDGDFGGDGGSDLA